MLMLLVQDHTLRATVLDLHTLETRHFHTVATPKVPVQCFFRMPHIPKDFHGFTHPYSRSPPPVILSFLKKSPSILAPSQLREVIRPPSSSLCLQLLPLHRDLLRQIHLTRWWILGEFTDVQRANQPLAYVCTDLYSVHHWQVLPREKTHSISLTRASWAMEMWEGSAGIGSASPSCMLLGWAVPHSRACSCWTLIHVLLQLEEKYVS